jgi:hypothetical protein
MLKKWHFYLIAVAIVLLLGILGGWRLHKTLRPCPVITQDTITLVDTVVHTIEIRVPYYIIHTDTIIWEVEIPAQVDTAFILKDYFAKHVYTREWKDSLLYAVQVDTVSQNKISPQSFSYKILRPQTIITNTIDNTTTYNSYLTVGFTMLLNDPKYWGVKGTLNTSKFYVGVGYHPSVKSFSIDAGIPIIKFRKVSK